MGAVGRTIEDDIYPVRNNAPLEFLTGFTAILLRGFVSHDGKTLLV
jgi:hypothetical protein